MRKSVLIILAAVVVLTAIPAFAELQTVQVGGQIRIRGNYYMGAFASPANVGFTAAGAGAPTGVIGLRWPAGWLPFRAIGDFYGFSNVWSPFGLSSDNNDSKFVEQRTRLNVKADFTDNVSAFIELDSYDVWGEDFRSLPYLTGFDTRAATGNDVEVYQAYIEAREMWDLPLTARIGRQEMFLGNGWLVGTNDTASGFTGLSFDAIRLTYATDMFSVDAFAAKLFEGGVAEEDGDIDFYGIYGSYKGLENIAIDAYWLWLRDAGGVVDTNFIWPVEWIENWLGLDDYDVTNIHTIGLRGAGTIGAFDFEAELAYQFGNAGTAGWLFTPFVYGDDEADYGMWAGNFDLGYTFDMTYNPRVFIGGAYFGGEDNRDITLLEWFNPFDAPQASVSFNRLFSNWEYSQFLDGTDLSNAWVIKGGVSANPTESIKVTATVSYMTAIEEFDSPVYFKIGRWRVPIAPNWPWWTEANSKDLGWETELSAAYNFSEDLSFQVGWAHLFTGDGLADGAYSSGNGLVFNGGVDSDDADYVYFETKLSF